MEATEKCIGFPRILVAKFQKRTKATGDGK